MAPDVIALSAPRSRPRAATAMQPTTTSNTASSPLSSRRPSQVMAPPLTSLPASVYTGPDQAASVRSVSGPLRHPKPLTPSDLHSMLEQEQEAMVNRLSRELSVLRQQTASVASTTSSTSTTLNDPVDATLHTNPSQSISSRRHRSSSSLSSSYIPAVQESRTGSVSGVAPARDTCLPSPRTNDSSRPGRSREHSLTSPQFNPVSPPALPHHVEPLSHYPSRSSLSQQRSRTTSITRPDELAQQRAELEAVRRENEALRRRVRELEHAVKRLREDGTAPPDLVSEGAASTDTKGASNTVG
ncbi:hypothetical protein FE257_011173 [Aspergillus nanangensis]|uniref:Uncharacterized protein n=1 Tax=Aspergillus nanangensis TaxID=2582783 RepID=A0AAD4GRL0_ASPNN|nr:hypothetical protein FE257_011173 [Aspergillus nanangensis]